MIFLRALGQIAAKMSGDKETDANNRAAQKLGGKDKMPYTEEQKSIELN